MQAGSEATGPLRVAVVQDAAVLFDLERTLERLERGTAEAAATGARLVVFPEAFVGGYPRGVTFGAVVGHRTDAGRELFRRYWDSAITLPGPAADRIAAAAAENQVYLAVGVIERDGGTLYCTVLMFGPDGALLGKHRKVMPTAMERLIWGQGDGSTMPVLDTEIGRIGAVICWENYMPLLRTAMYSKGIQLYLAPTADALDTWVATVRHIAKEGRCFVLSACQFVQTSDCPPDFPIADQPRDGVLLRGGSCIVAPTGDLIAGPVYGERAILSVDVDLADIARGKFDLDVVGHYARPDLFRLEVDETARVPVTRSTDN